MCDSMHTWTFLTVVYSLNRMVLPLDTDNANYIKLAVFALGLQAQAQQLLRLVACLGIPHHYK